MRWRRGADLPDGVSAGLRLGKRERPLATAALADGAWAVGTARRLVVLEPDGAVRLDRPWSDVDTAAWDGESGTLSIDWMAGGRGWLTVADTADIRLATVLRERVEASVVARHRVDVPGRGGARLVARRVGDQVVLQTALDRGTDPDDPLVVQALRRGRAELVDLVGPVDDPPPHRSS